MLEARLEGILVNARSLGGVWTTISFPELNVTIDIGACTPASLRTDFVALTHAHADHMAGLQAYLGVRDLLHMKPSTVIAPERAAAVLKETIDRYGTLQGWPFETSVQPANPGEDIALANGMFLRPFRTSHVIPTVGYCIARRVQKLKARYVGMPGFEIARLRQELGAEMFETIDDPIAAVTGDTLMEGLDLSDPLVRNARVLFVESTFVDDDHTLAEAHQKSHIHLDELAPVLTGMANRAVVLYHFSQSYRPEQVVEAVRRRLPEDLARRTHILLPDASERL